MRPLDQLYSGPSDILAKARRDRDALITAAESGNELLIQDKLFDFSVTAYHILDWIKSSSPHLEAAAYTCLNANVALQACRDIANSHKHNALDLASHAYRKFPPVVDHLDYSLSAANSIVVAPDAIEHKRVELVVDPPRRLKVQFAHGDRERVEDIAKAAVAAWETFFAHHAIC